MKRSTIRLSIADMIALGVRTKGGGDPARPLLLYQNMPVRAMSLMATVPYGDFTVSIPARKDTGCGFTIRRTLSTIGEGFTLVYALRPNRCCEAVKVLFHDRSYGIDEFYDYADRWLAVYAGALHRVADRYAFLQPSRELWTVIMNDRGYVAHDPAKLGVGSTIDNPHNRRGGDGSGVTVRIPLLEGDGRMAGPLSCIERVELTPDSHPGPESRWLSFDEFIKARAVDAQPPDGIARNFPDWLKQSAVEGGFESWIFRPGMLFGDRFEWWGDGNLRRSDHEGIDFAEGRRPDGKVAGVSDGIPIRAIEDGRVVSILDDFLCKTIVIGHPQIVNKNGAVLHTQYSHILPATESFGSMVAGNQIIGHVDRLTSAKAPVHFHFAAAWVPSDLSPDELTLNHLHPGYFPITLINFNGLLDQ